MLLADQHVTVNSYQNVRDVRAHFDCFTQLGDKYDFEVLSEQSTVNRGAEKVTLELIAVFNWIQGEYRAIHAVEFRVGTHVRVESFFKFGFLIFPDYLHHTNVQYETQNASERNANKHNQILN
jgi:hypothetical protein